ncbi:MAG: glucokinase [Ilumatobacter sp.]|jgi:glucokinase
MNPTVLPCYAVLDVGGTSIKVGAVRGTDVAIHPPLPSFAQGDRDIVLHQLRSAVASALSCAEQLAGQPPAGLAIAFPGPFDFERSRAMIQGHGKFDSIYGVDLRTELADALEPVFVRDSEAIGVGEAVFGAGRGAQRVLTCALGTGFGSCLTVEGHPQSVVGAQVIEQLHLLDTPDGRADDVLSATGLARMLNVATNELGRLLTDHNVSTATTTTIDEFATQLGAFLANVANDMELNLDLVVIAGGLAASFGHMQSSIASQFDPPTVAATLGANGALLGASQLAFRPDDPSRWRSDRRDRREPKETDTP